MLVENILYGGTADFDPYQSQVVAQLVAPPSGKFLAQGQDPLYLLRGVVREVGLGMGGKFFKPSIPWV